MARYAALLAACLILALAGPAVAHAEELLAESGSLTLATDDGGPCCPAKSWSYSTPSHSFKLWSYPFDPGRLVLFVTSPDPDAERWRLELAPPPGELLEPGTYTGATRTAFRAPGEPGIDVRPTSWCTDVIGDFTVHEVEYGPFNVLSRLRISFEEHCGSYANPALRGELDITVPPVTRGPYELDLQVDPVADRQANAVLVHGTIGCNAQTPLEIQVFARQSQKGRFGEVFGSVVLEPVCTGAATPFTARIESDATLGHSNVRIPWQRGELLVDATARANDDIYAFPAEDAESLAVTVR